MKKLQKILTLLLFIITPQAQLFAQKAIAKATIDTNNVLIGDHVKYIYSLTLPTSATVQFPFIADTLTSKVEILSKSKIDTALSPDKKTITYSQTLHIVSFDSGSYVLPSLIFSYRLPGDTTLYHEGTPPVMLYVNTIAVDTTKAYKDIKAPLGEPLTWQEILPWLIGAIVFIILVLLAIYIIRKLRRKEPIISLHTKPDVPPHIKALDELEKLRNSKIWQTGKIKEFHSALTDILRIYIEERFHILAMEMITSEVLSSLEVIKVNDEEIKRLEKILSLADMVKFAKYQPLPDEHDNSLKNAVLFVQNTAPKETTPEDNQNNASSVTDNSEKNPQS